MHALLAALTLAATFPAPPAPATVARVTTYYDMASANRCHNIGSAAAAIGRVTLPVGATFSFNDRTRSVEASYLEDRVFADGRVTTGRGGGVCQLASTLYAAALRAGMTITERHAHGLPVMYLPLGEDATVYDGVLDLRFRNDGPGPVTFLVEAHDGEIRVTFSGEPRPYTITVRHEELRRLPHGEEEVAALPRPPLRLQGGLDGARVRTYIDVAWKDGRTEHILMSDDTYRPIPRQVLVTGRPSA